MLIEFSVANFLSIKDRQTLRMDATSISEYPERVFEAGRHKLLRSAAIYGANASGKSNVLKALGTMRQIILTSAERSSTAEIDVTPFLLNTETEHAPSYFEVLFLLNDIQYRYGFEVDRKAVKAEWLFETKKTKEIALFLRENDAIEVHKNFKEGKGLEEKTRDNALFLAVCDQFNGEVTGATVELVDGWRIISGLEHKRSMRLSLMVLDYEDTKKVVNDFLNPLHLGFKNIVVSKNNMNDFIGKVYPNFRNLSQKEKESIISEVKKQYSEEDLFIDIKTTHTKYDTDNHEVGEILFEPENQESSGSNKVIALSGELIYAISLGSLAIIDELDAKLHPLLTQAIIRLFNDPTTNPKNAQLIFATHDTNLLTYGQFRRDQIWFTEKDQYGATCLYSLVEYKEENGTKIRKDRSFETDYIQGRYGAIPFIGDFSKLFADGAGSEN